ERLPRVITRLITWVTSRELYTGSGSSVRAWISARRGMSASPLGAVLRAGLLPVGDAGRVERGADDLVAEARQVLHSTAADQHDGVLLQVVPLTRDVRADLHRVRQTHARDLAQSRVRLLRRGRVHARADAALLRRPAQRRGLDLRLRRRAALANELIDGRHCEEVSSSRKKGSTQQRPAGPSPRQPRAGW